MQTPVRGLLVCAVCCLLEGSGLAQSAATPAEFVGTLERTLRPDPRRVPMPCDAVDRTAVADLPTTPAPDDEVCTGELRLQGGANPGLRTVVVEPAHAPAYLFVDADGDGAFSTDERFVFGPPDPTRTGDVGEVIVPIRRPTSLFASHPVRMILTGTRDGARRILLHSVWAVVRGTVTIQNQATVVEYEVPIDAATLDPARGLVGIDTNGDGRIDRSSGSAELEDARGEPAVLRAGGIYLSTRTIDLSASRVILRERAAGDYRRIELNEGVRVPDFTFTDLEGRERRLSDFHARYLLLDFWGTWCAPCVAEIPDMKAAYEEFRAKGFEIVGLDQETHADRETVKRFVAEHGMTWPQAYSGDNADLFDRFNITGYPTLVLLDSEHRVVSSGREAKMGLRGKALVQTLRGLLGDGDDATARQPRRD